MGRSGRPVLADTCRAEMMAQERRYLCLRRRGHLGGHTAGGMRWPPDRALGRQAAPPRAPSGRPDLHRRFVAVVRRALERADQEERDYRARLRPTPALSAAERRRLHGVLVDPRPRHRL